MISTLQAAALKDPGQHRDVNEDQVFSEVHMASDGVPMGLFIVCDGMGGHLAGEFASHWALETIKRDLAPLLRPPDPLATKKLSEKEIDAAVSGGKATVRLAKSETEVQVRFAVQRANQVVHNYASQKVAEAGDAGTTVTMAVVQGDIATIANVGDSRTYLIRDGRLRQITHDHSLVASLVASGQIQAEDIYTHPQKNVIFRSLGQKPEVEVDVFSQQLQPGDLLLLCSDGLWEMIQDPAVIVQILAASGDVQQAAERLIEAANVAGGEDNIGVVLVRVG